MVRLAAAFAVCVLTMPIADVSAQWFNRSFLEKLSVGDEVDITRWGPLRLYATCERDIDDDAFLRVEFYITSTESGWAHYSGGSNGIGRDAGDSARLCVHGQNTPSISGCTSPNGEEQGAVTPSGYYLGLNTELMGVYLFDADCVVGGETIAHRELFFSGK